MSSINLVSDEEWKQQQLPTYVWCFVCDVCEKSVYVGIDWREDDVTFFSWMHHGDADIYNMSDHDAMVGGQHVIQGMWLDWLSTPMPF